MAKLKTMAKVETLVLVVVGLFSSITILAYQEWGSIGIEVLSVVASVILTAFLVLLYFKQYELMRSSRRANVMFGNQIIANGGRLEFNVRNAGESVAYSIYLRTEISADTDMFLEPTEYQLRGIDDNETTLEPLSNEFSFQGKAGG